jgi:hypothetical protein
MTITTGAVVTVQPGGGVQADQSHHPRIRGDRGTSVRCRHDHRCAPAHAHETPEFADLANKYGLTYATPDWMDDVVSRIGLTPPSH